MPDGEVLVVLILREVGLRSALSARLSMAGADVITAKDIHDPALEHAVRGPAMLVLDEATVVQRSDEWRDAVAAQKAWSAIIVICPGEATPATREPDPRFLYLERANAAPDIAARVLALKQG